MGNESTLDVVIVGGGVAGLTAGLFTARATLSTTIVNSGESILRRNAHLENFPGFPAGVNSRLFLDMVEEQTKRAGCTINEATVTGVTKTAAGFEVTSDDGRVRSADRVIAASWADTSYLESLSIELDRRGNKQFTVVDPSGRTAIEGLYAAGRITMEYHQTIVSAGDGARVAITVIHDSDVPFYNDWVAPKGYFTDRGREVPPGCEEIDEAERRRRERESLSVMQEFFAAPHPDKPTKHPSLTDTSE